MTWLRLNLWDKIGWKIKTFIYFLTFINFFIFSPSISNSHWLNSLAPKAIKLSKPLIKRSAIAKKIISKNFKTILKSSDDILKHSDINRIRVVYIENDKLCLHGVKETIEIGLKQIEKQGFPYNLLVDDVASTLFFYDELPKFQNIIEKALKKGVNIQFIRLDESIGKILLNRVNPEVGIAVEYYPNVFVGIKNVTEKEMEFNFGINRKITPGRTRIFSLFDWDRFVCSNSLLYWMFVL